MKCNAGEKGDVETLLRRVGNKRKGHGTYVNDPIVGTKGRESGQIFVR